MNITDEYIPRPTSYRIARRFTHVCFARPQQSQHTDDEILSAQRIGPTRCEVQEPVNDRLVIPIDSPPQPLVTADPSAQYLFWESDGVKLYCGDALAVLKTLPAASVSTIVTSPPYAEQRKHQYGGIPAHRYPVWTANWMMAVQHALCRDASILINIREHIRNGQISDYVHKTRLLVREIGFNECEELQWIKPNGPPLGSTQRPRRCYERILWFGLSGHAYFDSKANGSPTQKLGFIDKHVVASPTGIYHGYSEGFTAGISRSPDFVAIPVGTNKSGRGHPAPYPVELAAWLVCGWSRPGAIVLDPFVGSGSTGVAAVKTGRNFIGIEQSPEYCAIAKERIEVALQTLATKVPRS